MGNTNTADNVVTVAVNREAKALEFKMNMYLMNKYKRFERVSLANVNANTHDDVNTFITNDINNHCSKNLPWKSLGMFEKWKHVQEYVSQDTSGIFKNLTKQCIKNMLVQNKLVIDYDKIKKKITHVSIDV